jgi:pimeloyl-ACP methyl ester carboxylesterase
MRGWGGDTRALDQRIQAALRAYLGSEPPAELIVIGSSQGAERAVALARQFPKRYRHLILASGANNLKSAGLQQLGGAYFFVGQYESLWPMQQSRDALLRAGIPARVQVVRGGGHADFKGQGDPLLREAFAFLGMHG